MKLIVHLSPRQSRSCRHERFIEPRSSRRHGGVKRKAEDMSPESFQQAYDCVVAASPDRRVLARLMWIAGMYLDRHPGVFQLPRALAEELLASDDFDQLLAGLKAIRHSSASTSETIAHFVEVMKRSTWEERYAGLYQLEQVVCGNAASVVAATGQSVLIEKVVGLVSLKDGLDLSTVAGRLMANVPVTKPPADRTRTDGETVVRRRYPSDVPRNLRFPHRRRQACVRIGCAT